MTGELDLIYSHTPWEMHNGIHVKREDLSCSGPSFSKVRGVWRQLEYLTRPNAPIPVNEVGVMDSRHSKAGWGVAYLAKYFPRPIKVNIFYPHFKGEPEGQLREYQQRAQELGAEVIPLWGGLMSAVLFNQARRILTDRNPTAYMFPNGLKLPFTVSATSRELQDTLPPGSTGPDCVWVVSASSATIAAGVCLGLQTAPTPTMPEIIIHLGYSRPAHSVEAYLRKFGVECMSHITIIDEGYGYADRVDGPVPFPCNPYYDRKAWQWVLSEQNGYLSGKNVYFWNIGA